MFGLNAHCKHAIGVKLSANNAEPDVDEVPRADDRLERI